MNETEILIEEQSTPTPGVLEGAIEKEGKAKAAEIQSTSAPHGYKADGIPRRKRGRPRKKKGAVKSTPPADINQAQPVTDEKARLAARELGRGMAVATEQLTVLLLSEEAKARPEEMTAMSGAYGAVCEEYGLGDMPPLLTLTMVLLGYWGRCITTSERCHQRYDGIKSAIVGRIRGTHIHRGSDPERQNDASAQNRE